MGAVLSPRRESSVRILLFDQSQGSEARRTLLADLGYTITATCTLQEALRRLTVDTFDIVVAEHPSPSSDAAQLVHQLRHARPRAAMVLISAYTEALGINEITSGADVVIQKSAHEVYHLTRAVARLRRRKPARKPPSSVLTTTGGLRRKTV